MATLLNDAADYVARTGANWKTINLELGTIRAKAPLCPKLFGKLLTASMGMANTSDSDTTVHVSLNYQLVLQHANERAEEAEMLMKKAQTMAEQLTDAYSLYSEADETARGLFNEKIKNFALEHPRLAGGGLALLMAGSTVIGSILDGKPNLWYLATGSSPLHEGILSALGQKIAGGKDKKKTVRDHMVPDDGTGIRDHMIPDDGTLPHLPNSASGASSGIINDAAGRIADRSAPFTNALHGDKLTVSQIHPKKGIGKTTSIEDTLVNVHDMRLNDVEVGSIAIQKYRRDDGSTAWMVTIPGTDGKTYSPFSWPVNIELMSSDEQERMAADSARMVDEAMRQAGVQPGDPVAMVGHSQGGIVAAVMASDFTDKYNIQHIVTAGSPVANHPIKEGIAVTSIEMNDELVSALDGAPNPSNPDWLTIRGTSQSRFSTNGTEVEGSGNDKSITHGMEYMKAAYQDAKAEGGPALYGHEQHFRQVINGELQETTYWRGRMSYK
ncbi:esterase/lipase family protein [Bifidobacterium callimiconis]|uniref:esterase/lipase family protein n=1 Tax=Bifidobacterium callimiconis TaxID=2306973 RepID=UPI0013DF9661|nr:alpha/beta hydrolase [Bifidobacterium callimiconis]MBT1176602.1 alpha/beta hydrolase [Bifidobacterium callimiconis]